LGRYFQIEPLLITNPQLADFTEAQEDEATSAWYARCEQVTRQLGGIRDSRSVETFAGIGCTLERNWFRDQLNEALIENARLLRQIMGEK
jgi:hypothetical protein